MGRQMIGFILFFAIISLVAIIMMQYNWMNNAYSIQKEQFNDKVDVALTNVAQELLVINKDSSQLFNPVKKMASNSYMVEINDTVNSIVLKNLLINEFETRNIKRGFGYAIYDCFVDSILSAGKIRMEKKETDAVYAFNDFAKEKDGHYFGVYFSEESFSSDERMKIWGASFVFIMIVLVFFGMTLFTILKQKRLSNIKDDFINNITHEFKTPISTISLSAEVLMDPNISEDPDRLKAYAGVIQKENNRLKMQVDKVLQLATLDEARLKLEDKLVDIGMAVSEAGKSFDLLLAQKNGKIAYELPEQAIFMPVDAVHFANCIHNLVDNAIKYSTSAPEIFIKVVQRKRNLFIEVRDNGIGISSSDKKTIFDKFFRVHTGNLHDVKGFGLGLNYVRTIVEAYGGEISLQSILGQGSTFTIKLPIKK